MTLRIAPTVQLNTPDGPIEVLADMSPVLHDTIIAWFGIYSEGLKLSPALEPDWDAIFSLASQASGIDEARIRKWGKMAASDIASFLAVAWGKAAASRPIQNETPTAESPSSPSVSPRRSKGQSR